MRSASVEAGGWDRVQAARLYEQFCARHGRYGEANAALVAHAALGGDQRVLDVGAGIGGTAESALRSLGPGATVLCFEPAPAMRAAGQRRLRDTRVAWSQALPEGCRFNRVLCGAAIWQSGPLREAIGRLAALVAAGGALSFTIPALYLGEPDDPGGGRDPLLLELLALVADGRVPQASPQPPPPSSEEVEALCEAAGLRPERWTLRRIVTQAEQRDWLKIPVLTDRLLPELAPEERSRAIDAAFSRTDPGSWRWERWYGWTAWRRRS